MRFISPKVGYAGGSNLLDFEPRSFLTNSRAVIYKTLDGGHTWKQRILSKGEVQQIEYVDGDILALVRVHTENSFRNLRYEIWKSNDLGDSWTQISKTQDSEFIGSIRMLDKAYGVAIVDYQRDAKRDSGSDCSTETYILRTKDGGTTWTDPQILPNYAGNMEVLGKSIVYRTTMDTIATYNPETHISTTLYELGELRKVLISIDKGIVVAGVATSGICIIRLNEKGDATRIPTAGIHVGDPVSFHVDGESMSLFVTAEASILGVSKHFYHTTNGGSDWVREHLPFPLVTEPTAYFGKSLIWSDCAAGCLQIRGSANQAL